MSLLEERIKRSSRKTINPPKSDLKSTVVTAVISPQKENTPPNRNTLDATVVLDVDNVNDENDDDMEEENLPPVK